MFLFYGFIVSLFEKESRAALRSLFLSLILPLPFAALFFISFPEQATANIILFILTVVLILIVFFPDFRTGPDEVAIPESQIDERDIMFSRKWLKEGSERYNDYYKRRPENLPKDEKFRSKPGLMTEGSYYWDPVLFAAAHATFDSVHAIMHKVDGVVAEKKLEMNQERISGFIKNWSNHLGALKCGVTELKDYHMYSIGGREYNYDEPVVSKHKFAIAFTVEMDREMMASAPDVPTTIETGKQYQRAGVIAVQVASFIRELGYGARAHIDGNYQVICPLVARDAGLGEIGRMGILMTPNLGPRVRISVVTTDLPLITDKQNVDRSVMEFCNICKKCAHDCPSSAISFDDRKIINGAKRWQIHSEACYTYWCISGTDCGRCMAICPYSHPDNLFHNFIRFGIRNFPVFRRVAVHMDDFFYGKKPKSLPVPDWMDMVKKD